MGAGHGSCVPEFGSSSSGPDALCFFVTIPKLYVSTLSPMQPAQAEACKSKEILHTRLRADLKVYNDAIQAMEAEALRGSSTKRFGQIAARAARAQEAYRRSSETLRRHIAEHGC